MMLTQDAIGRLATNGTSVGLVLRVLENGRPVGPKTRAYLTHREAAPVAAIGLAVQRLLELSRGGGDLAMEQGTGPGGGTGPGREVRSDAGPSRFGGDDEAAPTGREATRLVDRMADALLALQREDGLFGESPEARRAAAGSRRGASRSVGWMRDRGANGDATAAERARSRGRRGARDQQRSGRHDCDGGTASSNGIVTPAWSAESRAWRRDGRSGVVSTDRATERRIGPMTDHMTDHTTDHATDHANNHATGRRIDRRNDQMTMSGPAARPGGETSPGRGSGGAPSAASGPLVAASAVAVRALLAYRAHQARTARCGARPQARIDNAIERGMLALARRQTPDGRLNRDIVASAIVLWQLGREPAFIDAGADIDTLRTAVRREAARPTQTTDDAAVTPAFARLAG